MRIFVTKKFPPEKMELLRKQGYEVVPTDTFRNARGAHALLSVLTDKIDRDVMERAGPQLKVIANCAVGVDNVDMKAAKELGIMVTNTPDVLTEAVAEHAVALALGIARHLAKADRFMRQGKYRGWDLQLFLGAELKGKTLGILGHGRIGCRTADIFKQGFGMRVLYFDVKRNEEQEQRCGITFAELADLLKQADVVSIHVPLLPTTRHIIGEEQLRLMKQTSYVVNTSRGPVVDEEALVKALQKRQIAGAALDVFEKEPNLAAGLAKLDNVLLTPHIASATAEARENMMALAIENLVAALSGSTPPNLVQV